MAGILNQRVTSWSRMILLGAAAGPLVAAFMTWTAKEPYLSGLWQQPFSAILITAILGALTAFLPAYGAQTWIEPFYRRYRWNVWLYTAVVALFSVVFLLSFGFALVYFFGLPFHGHQAVETFGTVSGFTGITTLGVTAINGYVQALAERQDRLVAQAQVKALQVQLSPHFFFNTLNTIAAIIPEHPARAQETVRDLADLFRFSMESGRHDRVALTSELDFVRRYLSIEQARFGDRLRYSLPSAADADALEIPGLTLQPLVENAVRHGIAHLINGGAVDVTLQRHDRSFTVTITNPTDPARFQPAASFMQNGHALDMVKERLQLLYGEPARLTIEAAKGNVKVEVEIPAKINARSSCR